MTKPEEIESTQEIERKIRAAFPIHEPDQGFIDRLQEQLASQFKDLGQSSEGNKTGPRRFPWLDRNKLQFSPLAWGAIGIVFVLILIWGIKTLIPRVEPSISSQSTPAPTGKPTTSPTKHTGMLVPVPEEAITSANAGQIVELARWGKDTISSVTWAPNGSSFAVAASTKIHIYDSQTFLEIKTIDNGSLVSQIAYSPDGTKLASDFNNNAIKIREVASGNELLTLTGHNNFITRLAFSPGGDILASAAYQEPMKLWDANSGQEIRALNEASTINFGFSPDGALLATTAGDSRIISVWDVASGQVLRSFTGHTDYVYGIAFSSDGKMLATTSNDLTIKIWEVSTGKEIKTLNDQAIPNGVAFLPDGNTVISLSDGHPVTLWDITNGQVLRTVSTDAQPGYFALSPDGKTILTYAYAGDSIRLFDIDSGRELQKLEWQSYIVYSLAFSPDGKLVAVGLDSGGIKLLDATNGQELRSLSGHTKQVETMKAVESLTFSPDGKLLASGAMDQTTRLWDVASGEELATLDAVSEFGWGGGIPSVDFSPDGRLLAFGGPSGQVKVWDVLKKAELFTLGGQASGTAGDPVAAVAFSPDAKILASGYANDSITLWDTLSGQKLRTMSDSTYGMLTGISSLEFSQDGKVLAAGDYSAKINLWDINSGSILKTLALPWEDEITRLDFSPDGSVLAISSGMASTVLVDVATGNQLIDLRSAANGLAFSPDGKLLISSAFDGSIHLWGVGPPNSAAQEVTAVPPGPETTIIQEPSSIPTAEVLDVEKVPIPILLSGENIQAGEWSPDGSFFYYSQQGPVGEPEPNQAIVTIRFLDARTGEICEGIQETVEMVDEGWGAYPKGVSLYERARWLNGNLLLYVSPSGELMALAPCSGTIDNWSAYVPDVVTSLTYSMKKDGSQAILKGEQAYWLYTPSTHQSVKLDIPLPIEGAQTDIGWLPGEEQLYASRIEDRQGELWIVLERIDSGTGSASLVLEVQASAEIRNSSPMWAGTDWVSKDKVIIENTLDGMRLYDISSQPIQFTKAFPDLFGIEDPGMRQSSAWGPMCGSEDQSQYLILATGLTENGQYYIYHFDTGMVDQYPIDPPLLVVFPCGEGGVVASFVNQPSGNFFRVIQVDSGKDAYDLVVKGHGIVQNSWSFATIMPGAKQVMFSSVQGISLEELETGDILKFWGLDNTVEYQDFYTILSPDGKTIVGLAWQKSQTPGVGSTIQDMYWLRLEP